MFIVGKSFFSETLSKFNIKTIEPLCVIHIPEKMLAVGPLGYQKYGYQKFHYPKNGFVRQKWQIYP